MLAAGDWLKSISVSTHLTLGMLLRLLLIMYGQHQDETMEVKYTDVDYKVFTDAARHVYEGGSPYERHTYRYSTVQYSTVQYRTVQHSIVQYSINTLHVQVQSTAGMAHDPQHCVES